jgi:GDPmannose 4,6-dehydratase
MRWPETAGTVATPLVSERESPTDCEHELRTGWHGLESRGEEMKVKKKALITGITGQDGSYLAEFLLAKGYEVHGIVRRVALENPENRMWKINHLLDQLALHSATMENYPSIFRVMEQVRPDECYHLVAQSFVPDSFEDEFSTLNTNLNGTNYVLAALREKVPQYRFYFAGSSEMFGLAKESPQNEDTTFHPRSPYGISKVAGFHLTHNAKLPESSPCFCL